MPDLARANILVTGRVQGVFFRQSALGEAQRLGISGWVQNLPDGRVEAEVEGERAQLEGFVEWCHRGPPAAQVEEVRVRWSAHLGEFRTFQVLR